jgi:hypothetical protein
LDETNGVQSWEVGVKHTCGNMCWRTVFVHGIYCLHLAEA